MNSRYDQSVISELPSSTDDLVLLPDQIDYYHVFNVTGDKSKLLLCSKCVKYPRFNKSW